MEIVEVAGKDWSIKANGHDVVGGVPTEELAHAFAKTIQEDVCIDWSQWDGQLWMPHSLELEAVIRNFISQHK